MGNEHDNLNKEKRKIQKMRKEANKNKKKNNKNISSDEEDSNEEENNNYYKEKQIEEYDKEISKMLFDEEAEIDEGERLKKNKKIDKKSELKSYAEQIAEEQFMDEINRSKSVNRESKRRVDNSDDDNDSDDYDAYQRWKERKKKKKKINEKNEKEKKISIQVNDENNIKTENNKKIRYFSTNKYRKNCNNKVTNNELENDDNLNINYEREKNSKEKSKKNKIYQSNVPSNIFGSESKNKKEKVTNKNFKTKLSSPQIEYNYNNFQSKSINNIKMNGISNNQSQKRTSVKVSNQYGTSQNNNQMGINHITPGDLYTNQNQCPQEQPENVTGKKTAISKKVYSKIKPEDLKIVLLYMKNSNNKYQEGLDLCGKKKYIEAQTCFAQAKSSFINLKSLMNGNPKAYPSEFRNVIFQKINEKLQFVFQSIRECNQYIRDNKNNQIIQNKEKAKDILRNVNSNNNNDFNFNKNKNMNYKMNNDINNNISNKKKNIHDKEEEEMDEKIESEIMIKNPGIRFDDIVGMKEMKKILYEIIVVPTIRPDLFTGIRKPQRGILLFGPPGTGKTMIAKAIASECQSTFFNISASSLTSKWVGESEKTVKSLFKLAYKKVPSIIFIDEIDSILSKRSENENEATKRLKTEFLIQFDGLGSNANARLLVIAATNRPMDLDEALLRRLPKRVYCGPLDEEGRFEFIKKVINRVETNLSDKDIQDIAKITNGYSNSDLKELCKEAAFQPVRELTMDQILRIKKFRPLVKKDLVKSVKKIRGTLSHKVIDELLKWNEQFGGV